jgi:hypothetical protein
MKASDVFRKTRFLFGKKVPFEEAFPQIRDMRIRTTRLDLTHFRKDFERLTEPNNMVKRGYLLFFLRREDYRQNSGLLPMIDRLPERLGQEYERNRDRADNLVVLSAECPSPGLKCLKIIPEDRSSCIGIGIG